MRGHFALQDPTATKTGRSSARRGSSRGGIKGADALRKKSDEELDLLAPAKIKLPEGI